MYYINKHYTRKDVSIEERGFWVYKILNLLCKISHIKQVNKQEGVELIVQSWQYEFEFFLHNIFKDSMDCCFIKKPSHNSRDSVLNQIF